MATGMAISLREDDGKVPGGQGELDGVQRQRVGIGRKTIAFERLQRFAAVAFRVERLGVLVKQRERGRRRAFAGLVQVGRRRGGSRAVGDEQSETGAFRPFGREEKAEGLVAGLLIHPDPIIFYFKKDLLGVLLNPKNDLVLVWRLIFQAGIDGIF